MPVALVVVLLVIIAWAMFPGGEPPPAALPVAASDDQVELTIDFGDGEPRRRQVAWAANVMSALQAAGAESQRLAPRVRGQGPTAFVEAIGGVENEGPEGKNWTYEVNGTPGDRSAGVAELSPGDRVLWKFTTGE